MIFLIINAIKSIRNNINKQNKSDFQLTEAPIYMVVGPSAPPIIATADASEESDGKLRNTSITPRIKKTPEITKRIIFLLLLIFEIYPKFANIHNLPLLIAHFLLFPLRTWRPLRLCVRNSG